MHSLPMIDCHEVYVCIEEHGWGCIVQYTFVFAKDTGWSSRPTSPPSIYFVTLKAVSRHLP